MRSHESVNKKMPDGKLSWKVGILLGQDLMKLVNQESMPMPLNDLKVNIKSRVTIATHQVELGTRQPSGPPWSMSIGTEILIHDLTI